MTRSKSNTQFKRCVYHPVDRAGTSVLCDQTGLPSGHLAGKDYSTAMRQLVVKVKLDLTRFHGHQLHCA